MVSNPFLTAWYPADWVLDIPEPGKGGEFDFGYDELECGLYKFFDAHDAKAIMPYACSADFVMSRACDPASIIRHFRFTT